MQMKTCTKCKLEKSEDNFYKRNYRVGALSAYCKSCTSLIDKQKRSHASVSVERLRECFNYSDGNLVRKITTGGKSVEGSIVTNVGNNGYLRVTIDGKTIGVHKIIFAICKGYIPDIIDHLDGNPLNNKIENLEDSTIERNAKNKKRGINNTSGNVGVMWHSRDKVWMAAIKSNKKQIHLGYFENKEDAIKARKEAEIKYGFSPNHGRS